MASRVLTARKPTSPGTPPSAPHTRAPTTASEVFSATDSTTARAICCRVQRLRVAAAQMRQPLPGQLDVPGGQRPADGARLAAQRGARRRRPRWRRRSAPPAAAGRCAYGAGGQRGGPRRAAGAHERCAGRPGRGGRATAGARRPPRHARRRRRGGPGGDRRAAGRRAGRRRRRTRRSRSARTGQPAVAPRRDPGDRWCGDGDAGQPGMAICPHSGSAPWFDVTGDESLLASGSAGPPAFQSAVADRDFRVEALPGDSGGTAPDSHRLPLLPP